MPVITWICESCGKERNGGLRPPEGWNELSFWNGVRFVRFSFCSYACTAALAANRHEVREEAQRA